MTMRAAISFFAMPAVVFAALSVSPAQAACKAIKTAAEMQAINNDLAGRYCLQNDIDLASIANFTPIGTDITPFTGKFFGNDHILKNLTIDSNLASIGLFGSTLRATIQDFALVNAQITAHDDNNANVGAVVGFLDGFGGSSKVSRVAVTGKIVCIGNCPAIGGLIGWMETATTLIDSSSAADVSAPQTNSQAGGAVGFVGEITSKVVRTYATGAVTCGDICYTGGLVGTNDGIITHSFATGPVVSGANGAVAGGLVGYDSGGGGAETRKSFATGPVSVGANGVAGGLEGQSDSTIMVECYSTGPVSGGAGSTIGGMIGHQPNPATVTNSYWDTDTSGLVTSAGGTGKTTLALRAMLPAGFSDVWDITKTLSYPFLKGSEFAFMAPQATLVINTRIFTFLPIRQLDTANYSDGTSHIDQASLAAAYTMIARAVGQGDDVAQLKNVTIDKYFWKDSTEKTLFRGPLTEHATLGPLRNISATAPIGDGVIHPLKQHKLVLLRGSYTPAGGGTATHWMLATMYTANPDNSVDTIVANDPWTGARVQIDPSSKRVVHAPDFPLDHFRVDGFQTVTID